jgi:glycosyltransferase involved in cell wall biosynthesis
MKIHLDNVNIGAPTGPNVFAERLARRLFETGHEVELTSGIGCDVSLVFIQRSGAPVANKVVQRLDGIWFKKEDFVTKNVDIEQLYNVVDAVAFQSHFDRTFVTKHWGVPQRHTVIRNGIDMTPVTAITRAGLVDIRSKYDKVFVTSSNWHPQKRLRDNTRLFQHIRDNIVSNSCLIVLGAHPDCSVADKDVFYAGSQPHDVVSQVMAMSNWMLHLAYLDHSPNSVIEALAQGTPVICTNEGGTCELVDKFGIILNEPEKFDYEPTDYDDPPAIDVAQLTTLPDKATLGAHADISIETCAKRYIELFKSVL